MAQYKLWSQGERQDYEYTELEQGNGNGNNGNGKGNGGGPAAVPVNDWIPLVIGFVIMFFLLKKRYNASQQN